MKKNFEQLIEYFLITIIIYMSGSIFFIAYNYERAVKSIFFITIVIVMFKIKAFIRTINIKIILILIVLIISMMLTIIINNEQNINSYISIGIQICIAIMYGNLIKYESFKNKYINIMLFFSIVSIVFYILQHINPNIIYKFKYVKGIASLDYYNAYIHVYGKSLGYANNTLVLFDRNMSIFWEPGCFQAFLNLSLFFILNDLQEGKFIKKNKLKLSILIIALITTYSTTGYIILTMLIINYRKNIVDNINYLFPLIFILIIFGLLIININEIRIGFMINKVVKEFTNWEILKSRISLQDLEWMFYNGKINIFGMSFSEYYKNSKQGSANSIIHTMVTLGMIFSFILLKLYYNFSKRFGKNKILIMIILVMIFSTESLFWRPFFLYFAFISFYDKLNMNKMRTII